MKILKGLIIVTIYITLMGCAGTREEVSANAEKIGIIIENGDIDEISNLIFGIEESETISGLEEIIGTGGTDTKQEGILNDIFQRNTIKVGNISENTIEYEIEAPNLQEIFVEILNNKEILSEEQLLLYMKEYVAQAQLRKVTVAVTYTIENKEIVIDYQNQEFIDGITGGLLSAYQQLYQDMINEYMKEMESNE